MPRTLFHNLSCALIFPTAIQNTARFESINEWIVPTTPGRQFEHIKRLIKHSLKHIVIRRYKNRCRTKAIQTVHRQAKSCQAVRRNLGRG